MSEIMQNSRYYNSCMQHLQVMHTLKKNLQLSEHLNDACLQLVNKVKMEQITVFMRNHELAF